MASKTASVKLTLEGSSYIAGMRRVGDATTSAAKASGRAWEAARAGLDGMKRSAGETLTQMKSLLSSAATLGGALSAGKLFHDAVKMQSVYRDLAFRVGMATKAAVSWKDVQAQIEPIAARTSRRSEELAEAFGKVFSEVGDAGFAKAALEPIGALATATGRPVGELADIAGALGDKFGVTADQIPDALSAMIEFANRGGVGMEDLARVIHITGGSARAAGLMGEAGFRKMIAMANAGGDALGTLKKGLGAITGVLDQMVSPEFQKKLKLEFGVSTVGKDGKARDVTDILGDVLKKTKGKREKLATIFSGEQLKLVSELAKPFSKAFDETKGTVKEKTEAGLSAYQEALKDAGATTFNFAKAQEEARRRANDPEARFRQAMEKLSQATQKPEMIEAINSLAESLPQLADALAKFVGWAAKNPMMAGGALVGGKMAFAGLEAAIVSAFQKGGASGADSFGGALKMAGPWVAIAGLIGVGIIDAVVEANMKAQAEKDKKDTEKIRQDFVNLQSGIERAREKLETGKLLSKDEMRLARGDYTAAESRTLERGAALQLGGLPGVEALEKRKAGTGSVGAGALAMAGETSRARDAFERAGLLGGGPSGLAAGPEAQRLVEQQGGKDVKLGPEAGAELARNLSQVLGGKTLKVEVTNLPGTTGGGGGSGSRGVLPSMFVPPGYQGP